MSQIMCNPPVTHGEAEREVCTAAAEPAVVREFETLDSDHTPHELLSCIIRAGCAE